MCDGGGDEEGGKGTGRDDSSTMGIVASIENGGRRCPTAAMMSHSRQKGIQQSTYMLCDGYYSLKLEYIMIITTFMAYIVKTNRRIVAPDQSRM